MTSGHLGPVGGFASFFCSALSCKPAGFKLSSPASCSFATGWFGPARHWGGEGRNWTVARRGKPALSSSASLQRQRLCDNPTSPEGAAGVSFSFQHPLSWVQWLPAHANLWLLTLLPLTYPSSPSSVQWFVCHKFFPVIYIFQVTPWVNDPRSFMEATISFLSLT